MIVNPDGDGYTKTRNHRKTLRKTCKKAKENINLHQSKRIRRN